MTSETTPPALRIDQLLVRAQVALGLGTTQMPRDLPNLARVLIEAVAPEPDKAHRLLDRLTLDVARGERIVLLGEEGCGKTTLARACARLVTPDGGSIAVDGVDVTARRRRDALQVRRKLQVVFDDIEAGLNPRRTVRASLREAFDALALGNTGAELEETAGRALQRARLALDVAGARAGELSAGVRARASLARALLADPAVLVIDEPTARLDPLERAALLEALARLAPAAPGEGTAVLALTQRPDVARALAQRVGVLYLGALVEVGDRTLLDSPLHPYSRGFLAAAPQRSRPAAARAIVGELPSVAERPAGCAFHPRCPDAIARCSTERPVLIGQERQVACHVVNATGG